jgi:hypothetical protein
VAYASDEYIRKLKRRGYTVPERTNGNGHKEIWFGDVLVTITSSSRGFRNLKSKIRQFEEDKPTRTTRTRRAR